MHRLNCLVVLGPTASGKTSMACRLAGALNGEIISADSRQVYKGLDIGTGKDLSSYDVNGRRIPCHLIDVVSPHEQYYLHDFVRDLGNAFEEITARGRLPIVCGGTGLYLEALAKDHGFTAVPEDRNLRKELETLTTEVLRHRLAEFSSELTQHVDRSSRKRLIRGVEVASWMRAHGKIEMMQPAYRPLYLGIELTPRERRERVRERLEERLRGGLIEEVAGLLTTGVPAERLVRMGLEYKFVTLYIENRLSRQEMEEQLLTAIRQYAKRQMTWFRRMERSGIVIHWRRPDAFAETAAWLQTVFG